MKYIRLVTSTTSQLLWHYRQGPLPPSAAPAELREGLLPGPLSNCLWARPLFSNIPSIWMWSSFLVADVFEPLNSEPASSSWKTVSLSSFGIFFPFSTVAIVELRFVKISKSFQPNAFTFLTHSEFPALLPKFGSPKFQPASVSRTKCLHWYVSRSSFHSTLNSCGYEVHIPIQVIIRKSKTIILAFLLRVVNRAASTRLRHLHLNFALRLPPLARV